MVAHARRRGARARRGAIAHGMTGRGAAGMTVEEILVSAGVGAATSMLVAFFTARLQLRREAASWRREFAIKFSEAATKEDKASARAMASQFAIGMLIV